MVFNSGKSRPLNTSPRNPGGDILFIAWQFQEAHLDLTRLTLAVQGKHAPGETGTSITMDVGLSVRAVR